MGIPLFIRFTHCSPWNNIVHHRVSWSHQTATDRHWTLRTDKPTYAINQPFNHNCFSLLRFYRYYGYWTDIKDWTKEDKAPEMVAFSGWSHGLPKRGKSAAGSNRCPYLDMALNLDWNDANCDTTQLPYICEYKATLEKNGNRWHLRM